MNSFISFLIGQQFFMIMRYPLSEATGSQNATCIKEIDVDYFGNDLITQSGVASDDDCCQLCHETADCAAWTYNIFGTTCYMKFAAGMTVSFPSAVSGIVVTVKDYSWCQSQPLKVEMNGQCITIGSNDTVTYDENKALCGEGQVPVLINDTLRNAVASTLLTSDQGWLALEQDPGQTETNTGWYWHFKNGTKVSFAVYGGHTLWSTNEPNDYNGTESGHSDFAKLRPAGNIQDVPSTVLEIALCQYSSGCLPEQLGFLHPERASLQPLKTFYAVGDIVQVLCDRGAPTTLLCLAPFIWDKQPAECLAPLPELSGAHIRVCEPDAGLTVCKYIFYLDDVELS